MDTSHNRLFVLRVLVVSLFVALAGRLFVMQVIDGDQYQVQAANSQTREAVVPAPRGLILDQAGRVVVGNRQSMVVTISRTAFSRLEDDGQSVLEKLAPMLNTTARELAKRLTICGTEGAAKPPLCWNGSQYQPIPVAEDLPFDIAVRIAERTAEFPGVEASLQTVRTFPRPLDVNMAHILGYLGPVNDAELEASKNSGKEFQETDLIGRSGVESFYDTQLRGIPGITVYSVDRALAVTGTVSETAPTPGKYLVLGVDAALQRVVEDQLEAAVKRARSFGFAGDSGAAVVMDVKTGQIMAMASYPNYNPRIWLDGVTETEYKRLTDESANAPLISRATQGLFPPASTFKVVTTLAAERARVPMGSTLYECPSFLQIGDRKMRNNESNAYGNISVARALEVSCNTVFYRIGYQMWLKDGGNNPQKSPADPIEKAARDFGFGKQTGIDLPSENSGRVGGRAFKTSQYEQYKDIWCFRAKQGYPKIAATDPERAAYLKLLAQENCRYGYIYRGGDAANLSIGQGDTVATPLQVAQLYSAIANGGTIYQPRVVKAIVSADGKTIKKIKPKVAGKVKISASLKAYLDRALSGVVTEGTATSPFANWPQNRVAVAAKTGSGQMGNNKDATSWFASYAPVNNPRYAVVMMVSQGGTGALTSGPSVRKIYEAIYGIEGTDRKKKSAVLENSEPAKRLPTIKKDGSVNAVPGTKRIDELLRAKYIGGGNG